MKKIILIIIVLLFLASCQSKDVYFTKTCTTKVKSKDLQDIKEEKITYNNKDIIKNIEITRNYTSDSKETINYLKKSLKNYNNNLLKNKNIKIKIVTEEDNKYKLKYFYEVDKMNKQELDDLNINKNWIKYSKKLKRKGFRCKRLKK